MTPQQWSEIKSVFLAALERPAGERAAFLDEACGGDDEALRREVEALLGSHQEVGGFLETPAALLGGEARAALAAGQMLTHYRVVSLLGAGGMGEVHLAHDTRLRRKVALKLLPEQFTADRESLLRFEREAHAASALNHPNIITVYDIGENEGTHFIATEYVEGRRCGSSSQTGPCV